MLNNNSDKGEKSQTTSSLVTSLPELHGEAKRYHGAFTRRQKRAYHRVMSGLEKGGDLRLLTLTSSPLSQNSIQRDFRRLVMRLRRRNLLSDYFQVTELTKSGLAHKHIIFRGSYIEQAYLSRLWEQLHQAPVVDIRRIKGWRRCAARYVAKYLSKGVERWSWSWGWVWRGFVKAWEWLKRCAKRYSMSWSWVMRLWRWHLKAGIPLEGDT